MTSIRFGNILHGNIDETFYCWVRKKGEDKEEAFIRDKASKYWEFSFEEKEYTVFSRSRFSRPPGLVTVSLRSRETFRFGFFQLYSRLPSWTEGPMLWFGFEVEDLFGGGVVNFKYQNGKLFSYAGGWGGESPLSLALPVEKVLSTNRRVYSIRVYKGLALWFVDSSLVGVAVLSNTGSNIVLHEGYPYSIGITSVEPGYEMGMLLDIDGEPTNKEWIWEDLHPWNLRVTDGYHDPSLYMSLYNGETGKPLVGERVSNEFVTLPVPVGGHKASLYLTLDGEAEVAVEYYETSGGWFSVYEKTLLPGKTFKYTGDREAFVARLRINPRYSSKVLVSNAVVF